MNGMENPENPIHPGQVKNIIKKLHRKNEKRQPNLGTNTTENP